MREEGYKYVDVANEKRLSVTFWRQGGIRFTEMYYDADEKPLAIWKAALRALREARPNDRQGVKHG